MAEHPSSRSSTHPSGQPSPQGLYGPPVPMQFISTNPNDGMQPLALVKRDSGNQPPHSHGQPGSSHQGQHIPSLQPVPKLVDATMNPKVIVTTRTPIFIKSPTHISPMPRQNMMAHTQSTQSIASVRPSLVMNPRQLPPALVRIPANSPRLTQVHPNLTQVRPIGAHGRPRMTTVRPGLTQVQPGLQFRSIFPSPRIPLKRSPGPAHIQPLHTPPPHRSPKLQTQTPPVAHMVNRTPPMLVRPTHHSVPFPAHVRTMPGPRARTPPSTQQVRPMIVSANNSRLIRPGSLLTIPGTPGGRIQASLGAMPVQSSRVAFKSSKGHMVIAPQSSKSPSGSPATQLSPSNARPVIFAPRHLLPANLKNQSFQVGEKVFVTVNPHGVKPHGQEVKIQAKPVTPIAATSPMRGNLGSVVMANQPQILLQTSSESKSPKLPYTGKKRGRKKGSKNRPKPPRHVGPIKIRILPTTAVPGIPQKRTPTTTESVPPPLLVRRPEPTAETATTVQEKAASGPLKEVSKSPQEQNVEGPGPQGVANKEAEKRATEIPRAVVKPTILTHVIDGFIIEESKEPFPMPENSSLPLAVNADGTKTSEEPRGVKRGASETWETSDGYLRCEFCGKMDFPRKFKRSKRFCSMACAKRYNVGCTKRLGLFSPKEEKPTRVKHKLKLQGPKAKPLKGARGKYGRLKYNITQPWEAKKKIVYEVIRGPDDDLVQEEGQPSTSEGSHTTSSSSATVSPLISEADSMPFPDEELPPGLPVDPGSWSVMNVRDFIKSVPGCNDFAEEFHSQEIDGQALMLLKEDHLMTTMNMKLGPALKIISKINTLRGKQVTVQ